jgi:hypothetical protein
MSSCSYHHLSIRATRKPWLAATCVWDRLAHGYTVSEALLKPNDAYFRVERYRAAVEIIACLLLLPTE